MDLSFVFATLMRFAHIAGAIVVLGGLFRAHISGLYAVDSYRKWLIAGAIVLVLSGAWQFMLRMHDAPRFWHAGIGIKILLALHVIEASIRLGREGMNDAKRARLARSAIISGWLVVLAGAFLRNLK